MAFNLFGLLSEDKVLATRLLDPLLPRGAVDAAVRIEWAPPSAQHLADATSFDVAVRYTTRFGEPAIAGIETKLTASFSPKSYGLNDHHSETYRRVAQLSTVWRDPMEKRLVDPHWNQLWRNHLLVESIRHQEPGLLGCQVIVHHEQDKRCAAHVGRYEEFLADAEQSFRHYTLRELVAK